MNNIEDENLQAIVERRLQLSIQEGIMMGGVKG